MDEREIKKLFYDKIEIGTSIGKKVYAYQDLAPEIRKLFIRGEFLNDGSGFDEMVYSSDEFRIADEFETDVIEEVIDLDETPDKV